jgi:outer membrane lipoprotein-sorting protein
MSAGFVVLASLGVNSAQAQDGNTIVRKMITTYQSMQTFQETSEAKVLILGGPQQIQSSTFKYQKPSMFVSTTSDPQNGSIAIYSDGKAITVYGGRQNLFTRRDVQANLAQTVSTYERVSDEVMGMKIKQMLSPMSILMAKGELKEANRFKLLGSAKVDGKDTYVVASPISAAWVQEIVGNVPLMAERSEVRIWIDKQTNQMLRGACRIVWKAPAQIKGKIVVQGFVLQEEHRNIKANASIVHDDFRFAPPAGSKQLFQEKR